jgi:hypothetical protein
MRLNTLLSIGGIEVIGNVHSSRHTGDAHIRLAMQTLRLVCDEALNLAVSVCGSHFVAAGIALTSSLATHWQCGAK